MQPGEGEQKGWMREGAQENKDRKPPQRQRLRNRFFQFLKKPPSLVRNPSRTWMVLSAVTSAMAAPGPAAAAAAAAAAVDEGNDDDDAVEIGRASCRERV